MTNTPTYQDLAQVLRVLRGAQWAQDKAVESAAVAILLATLSVSPSLPQ